MTDLSEKTINTMVKALRWTKMGLTDRFNRCWLTEAPWSEEERRDVLLTGVREALRLYERDVKRAAKALPPVKSK